MQTRVYEMGKDGKLVESVSKFDDLTPGTVIQWGGNMGFPETTFCILAKLPEGNYGAMYDCYNMDKPQNNKGLQRVEARSIKSPDDPSIWHSQHYFIQPEVVPAETVAAYLEDHKAQRAAFEAREAELKDQNDKLEALGRELWVRLVGECPAVIVAEHHVSDCDGMTDYFASHAIERVILAPSKHKRDMFPEFRKAAGRIPETKHMETAPAKPEGADEWWHPDDEHREKYSMGAGYYLSDGGTYSGWHVEKHVFWKGGPSREDYICLAKRHDHLMPKSAQNAPSAQETAPAPSESGDCAYTLTIERDWSWVKFPCKPSRAVLDTLDKNGGAWGRRRGAWYFKRHLTEAEVNSWLGVTTPEPEPAPDPVSQMVETALSLEAFTPEPAPEPVIIPTMEDITEGAPESAPVIVPPTMERNSTGALITPELAEEWEKMQDFIAQDPTPAPSPAPSVEMRPSRFANFE